MIKRFLDSLADALAKRIAAAFAEKIPDITEEIAKALINELGNVTEAVSKALIDAAGSQLSENLAPVRNIFSKTFDALFPPQR